MNKVKNQHFVPRFYLKHFTNSNDKIAAYDVRTDQAFLSNIENVAQRKYFYDHKPLDDFADEQATEKALSYRESEAGAAYDRLINSLTNGLTGELHPDDRIIMAEHISMQMMRTPEQRKISEEGAKEFIRQMKEKGADQAFIDKYTKNFDSKDQQLYSLFGTDNKERTWSFFDRFWIFWKNTTRYNFYTSDHPVVGYTHRVLDREVYEIFYPLTPKFGLTLLIKEQCPTWKDKDNTVQILDDPEAIKVYNELIVRRCNRQIYSSTYDFGLAKKIVKTHPEVADPDRPRVNKMK